MSLTLKGGEPSYPEERLWEQKRELNTNSTYDDGTSSLDHIGGTRVPFLLRNRASESAEERPAGIHDGDQHLYSVRH